MAALESCNHRFSLHGLAVDVVCEVPGLNVSINRALGEFAVSGYPDGFTPATGTVSPYEQTVVLRHLSPTATPVATAGDSLELYEEGERFWVVDDRWGLCEMNLLKSHWHSWVLPRSRAGAEANRVVEQAVLWPLAQVLRTRGLTLLPAASVARDGWGALLISRFGIEPELRALVEAGFRIIGQQWTALREEDGRVAMLHLPGQVQRIPAPKLRNSGGLDLRPEWIDLNYEFPGALARHAFCDAVVLIDGVRRPMPAMRQISRNHAVMPLRQAWPIVELHPQRRHGQMAARLAQQSRVYEAQLSRRPEDFLGLLDSMHGGRLTFRARSVPRGKIQVFLQPPAPRSIPA